MDNDGCIRETAAMTIKGREETRMQLCVCLGADQREVLARGALGGGVETGVNRNALRERELVEKSQRLLEASGLKLIQELGQIAHDPQKSLGKMNLVALRSVAHDQVAQRQQLEPHVLHTYSSNNIRLYQ